MAIEIKQRVNEEIKIVLPFDPSLLEDLSMDIFQHGELITHKGADDCTVSGYQVTAELTEFESGRLSPQRASINFRGLYNDGGTVIIEDVPCTVRRSQYNTAAGCEGSCSGFCLGGCTSCTGTCSGTCSTTCSGTCSTTCTGGCSTTCTGTENSTE